MRKRVAAAARKQLDGLRPVSDPLSVQATAEESGRVGVNESLVLGRILHLTDDST